MLGGVFHLVLDYAEIFINKDPKYVKASFVYVYFSNKNKKEF